MLRKKGTADKKEMIEGVHLSTLVHGEKTLIIIAHRLATIKNADRMMAMIENVRPETNVLDGQVYVEAVSSFLIQDFHVVLGDPNASYRTTVATDMLRIVKQEFKQAKRGQGVRQWMQQAIQVFYRRLGARFQSSTTAWQDDDNEVGRVLIKCNRKTMTSRRVQQANVCRFAGDATAQQGCPR